MALAEAGLLNAFANLSNVLAKLITPPTSIPVGAEIIVEGREILHAMTSAHRELGRIEAAGDDEARRVVASFRDLHLRIQHWEHLYLGR